MSWRDCIQAAVDAGRITAARGAEAHGAYDREFARATAGGMEAGAADMQAADFAVETITTLKKEKRWQRVNEMQRAKTLHDRIMSADKPWEELEAIINDLEYADLSVQSFAMANLDQLLMEYKPKMGGWKNSTAGLDDAVRAHFGGAAPEGAKELATAISKTMNLLREWANMHGAAIPEGKNAYLFQTHDAVKVSSVSEDKWVSDHLREGVLDWEVMRYAGKKIEQADREEILKRTYRGIVTDGADRALEAQGNTPNLATRLNRDRFLHYANADSWIEMQGSYGAGNLFEQTIGMIQAMAKDISLLRVFGPNADSMREFVKRTAKKRGGDLDLAVGANQRRKLKKTEQQTTVFDREYEIHSRHTPSLEGNLPMQTFSAIRTIAVGAKLGAVLFPSMAGDLANAKVARRMFNLPTTKVVRSYFADFIPTKENTAGAIRAGVIFENGISLAHSRVRYFGSLDGPHWARRFSDITYRMGLAAHHTQVIRNSEGKQFMGILADHIGMKFDDLPFAAMLAERGITPAEWDVMRAIPAHNEGGATFLRPIDAWGVNRAVAEKFSDLMQMYVRTAVPSTTLRQRAAMGEAIDPNSFWGQAVRSMGSLASFPVSIYFNQLRRIANAPTIRDKMTLGAMYFAWMTAGGMFITQAKALVQGQNLYNMNPLAGDTKDLLDFYGRSVINGGSLGILGDLVFNNINLSNSRYKPGNPTAGYFKSLQKLTLDNMFDAAAGRPIEIGKDAKDFIGNNVPDLFYIRLLWDRAVEDELERQVDPKGYAQKKRYEREHATGMWWGTGRDPEMPQLDTAFGG